MASIKGSEVKKVVVACDAGMGSSVLLTSQMKQRLAPYQVTVVHSPVNQIPDDADVILCHTGLAGRARQKAPDTVVVPFNMFMGDPVFNQLEAALRDDSVLES
jgi:galactose PTS system EIIB component